MAAPRFFSVCLFGLLVLFCPVLAYPSLSKRAESLSSKGFSVAVSQKQDHQRDFVRDWAAAHLKWGNGVPEQVSSTFQLLDSSKSSSADLRDEQA
jgi:hypothetical protein